MLNTVININQPGLNLKMKLNIGNLSKNTEKNNSL